MKEKDLEATLLVYLNSQPRHICFAYKQDCSGTVVTRKDGETVVAKRGKHRPVGLSDILVCYRGRFVALEVKVPKRVSNLTKFQQQYLDSVGLAGGFSAVVTSLEDVKEVLQSVDKSMMTIGFCD